MSSSSSQPPPPPTMIKEAAYLELLQNCAQWNNRIDHERRSRNPFFDAQTGVAQRPGAHLYRSREERLPGKGRVAYVYPARRWMKRRRSPHEPEPTMLTGAEADNPPPVGVGQLTAGLDAEKNSVGTTGGSADGTPLPDASTRETSVSNSALVDYSELSDSEDFGDESEDDYEDYSSKKRKGRGGTGRKTGRAKGRGRTSGKEQASVVVDLIPTQTTPAAAAPMATSAPVDDKPYTCIHCPARYKSKAGLSYHFAHVHNDFAEYQKSSASSASSSSGQALLSATEISNFCDFCLGDPSENKKTGHPEDLVSCHDCGRSGHPSCLNFTSNMMISTKKYGWQCIECKSCAICGTSENDDQLLFCDDCDRGFHLYCLRPPLSAPPEGEWSCHLCQVEFGPNASRPTALVQPRAAS